MTESTWPLDQDEHAKTAPGPLELVRRFINSADLEGGTEELADPASAARWLLDHGLTEGAEPLSQTELDDLLALREGLRDMAEANHSGADGSAAAERVAAAAASSPFVARATGEVLSLAPGTVGARGAIAQILAIVVTAQADGTWGRIKACRRESCRWVFYDQSRNRSASWCSMQTCGNRTKAQRFRQRHSAAARSS